jgi:hypothetical protein
LTFAATVLGLHPACFPPEANPPNLQRRLESGDFGVPGMAELLGAQTVC